MRVSLEFDFENYKINFCKNPLCKFFKEGQTFITYYDCFDYHISDDRRRKVTISDNKFNYSPKYYYDSTDNNLTFCGNSFEFYYHPLNYKSKKCEKSRCFDNFCPFFHKPEEKEFFENYRKKFTNIKFQSIFDPVFELCLQIDDKLKLNQPILVKKEDLIQIPENITITKTESISSSIVKKNKNITKV